MKPSFGSALRALRLGYYWSSKYQFFIRICDATTKDKVKYWNVEILPRDIKASSINAAKTEHRVLDNVDSIIYLSPVLRNLVHFQITEPLTLSLKDNGTELDTK